MESSFIKKDMIFLEEFESYLDDLYKYDVTKGVYITTGVFEQRIRDKCSFIPMYKKIKLVDKYNFIKDQLGVNGKALEVFKENRFKLYKYLPN
jgi:restriction endonuclease Mrr